jgi:stage II sporulation protein E
MEAKAERRFCAEFATASLAGSDREVSGDSAIAFESSDDRFFALLSDGMGTGTIAHETSAFVTEFLRGMLDHGYSSDTLLHILNGIIRARGDECSATVDLFELDLMSSEAQFIKSGAAASFVKRDSSIFRIRSRTAPIGLLKNVDAERVKVEIKCEDYVIMLSDGVNQAPDEAPWLLELLAKPAKRSVKEYADFILAAAQRNSPGHDDMTVAVVKISAR